MCIRDRVLRVSRQSSLRDFRPCFYTDVYKRQELQIARSRAGGVGNTRYVVHLRKQEQVFIRVRFVHKEIINAEFLKDKHVVFLRFVE